MFYSGASFFTGAPAPPAPVHQHGHLVAGHLAAYFLLRLGHLLPDSVPRPAIEPAVYYDTAVMIITFILLGRWLEADPGPGSEACARSSPGPPRRVAGARLSRSAPGQVAVGDLVVVRPGKNPVDGIVAEG